MTRGHGHPDASTSTSTSTPNVAPTTPRAHTLRDTAIHILINIECAV